MNLVKFIGNFFSWIFGDKKKLPCEEESLNELRAEEIVELENKVEEIQKFKSENVIFNKLIYLEQYIKIFSLTFPNEYNEYLKTINDLKNDYTAELEEFKKGFNGNITFSVDPEYESKRYVEVVKLEEDIKLFVDFEVDYKVCKDKFAKLCYKLHLFYNTLLSTDIKKDVIINQLYNAYNSFEKLVKELNDHKFLAKDSRKKDDILSYIIYSDYIIFKSALRLGVISQFDEYKQEISKIHSYFNVDEYEQFMFKFFIENFERFQELITSSLNTDKMHEYILKESQNLEMRIDDYSDCFRDYTFFTSVIKLENTLFGLIKLHKINFSFDVSQAIDFNEDKNEIISVNNIAKSMLSLIGNKKSALLEKIINAFKVEISWREFFFLCKIFELNNDMIQTADNTVFSMVKDKFLKLEEKYNEYSGDYIKSEKTKILNYTGEKSKKYILLFKTMVGLEDAQITLKMLSLDFVVHEGAIYLNHSYFNGFKNLEENFGEYTIF